MHPYIITAQALYRLTCAQKYYVALSANRSKLNSEQAYRNASLKRNTIYQVHKTTRRKKPCYRLRVPNASQIIFFR